MSTRHATYPLQDQPIPVRARLAAAWTSFLFLYVYVDLIGFYKPGVVEGILAGRMWEFDATQAALTTGLAFMAIPILMVVLSVALPARASRTWNLIVASWQIPFAAFNLAGGDWLYYYGFGLALELVLLAMILRWAWTWPRTASGTISTSADRESVSAQPRG
jgi:hypothetical protein